MRNYHSDPTANTAIANVMRKQERMNEETRKTASEKQPSKMNPNFFCRNTVKNT